MEIFLCQKLISRLGLHNKILILDLQCVFKQVFDTSIWSRKIPKLAKMKIFSNKLTSFGSKRTSNTKRETFLLFVIHHFIFFAPFHVVCQKQRDNNSSSSQVSNLKNAYVIYPLSWFTFTQRKTQAINRADLKIAFSLFHIIYAFLVDS